MCFDNILNLLYKKDKYKIAEPKKHTYYNIYTIPENDCQCKKHGPPMIGTCNICGAWKVY